MACPSALLHTHAQQYPRTAWIQISVTKKGEAEREKKTERSKLLFFARKITLKMWGENTRTDRQTPHLCSLLDTNINTHAHVLVHS